MRAVTCPSLHAQIEPRHCLIRHTAMRRRTSGQDFRCAAVCERHQDAAADMRGDIPPAMIEPDMATVAPTPVDKLAVTRADSKPREDRPARQTRPAQASPARVEQPKPARPRPTCPRELLAQVVAELKPQARHYKSFFVTPLVAIVEAYNSRAARLNLKRVVTGTVSQMLRAEGLNITSEWVNFGTKKLKCLTWSKRTQAFAFPEGREAA